MSILNQLASVQGINSTEPNKLLARQLVADQNKAGIKELVDNLTNKQQRIQSDCIKTLYEAGEQDPKLIAPHADVFIKLLDNKNNRMVWGAMTALSACAPLVAPKLYKVIARIVDIADKGSVITRDHAVNILVSLSAHKEYAPDTLPLLLEQILAAPVNQMPTYAEKTLTVVDAAHKQQLLDVIRTRLPDIEGEAKLKRLEKVIRKLSA
jgi:hypothetical protein